jgi:hypothetical protein
VPQGRSWAVRTGGAARRAAVKLQRLLRDNERLLVVAVSSMLMSASHTALRPVLPLFAKAGQHARAALMLQGCMQLHAGLYGGATPACMRCACKLDSCYPRVLRPPVTSCPTLALCCSLSAGARPGLLDVVACQQHESRIGKHTPEPWRAGEQSRECELHVSRRRRALAWAQRRWAPRCRRTRWRGCA